MVSQRAPKESFQISLKKCSGETIMSCRNRIFSWCIVFISLGVSQAAGNADCEGAVSAAVTTRCGYVASWLPRAGLQTHYAMLQGPWR